MDCVSERVWTLYQLQKKQRSSWLWTGCGAGCFLGRACRCAGRRSPRGETECAEGPRTLWVSAAPLGALVDGHRCRVPLYSHNTQQLGRMKPACPHNKDYMVTLDIF